jgi:UDP-galactopyranose mutase
METAKEYDYLIVGAGLFGSVFARLMTDNGRKCIVIDKRDHIAGNCYTENIAGVNVHKYGPHIFHTNDFRIWTFVNKYVQFNNFVNRPKVVFKDKLYSFPINLMTLYQLWGVRTPLEAEAKLKNVVHEFKAPKNLEEWILSKVGTEIYETFIKGYTKKQWMMDPKNLPPFIIKRLPIRLTYDDNYYNDRYQGIPIGGYTKLFQNLLKNVDVRLNADFFNNREWWLNLARKVVFTGCLDEFYNYRFGELEYRSLQFEMKRLEIKDFQGNAQINFTDEEVPFTRIIEHKHFEFGEQPHTIITREYPNVWKKGEMPYYPLNDERNNKIYEKYAALASQEDKILFGGRLAQYRYFDMHQVIGSALKKAEEELLDN